MKKVKSGNIAKRTRHPFVGLATVLAAVLVFLVALVALTALVRWIVM